MSPKRTLSRVRFVSRVEYPDSAANALQTIQMAAAFSRVAGDCRLFVHSLKLSSGELFEQYGVQPSPLLIASGGVDRWPRALREHGRAKFLLYNSSVAARLGFGGQRQLRKMNVLFVRSRLELNYWGLLRPYLPWLRTWRFVYESHDLETGPLGANTGNEARLHRALLAMRRFDVVVAITKALAEDIREASEGAVRPHVVTLASALPRLERAPEVNFNRGRPIVLGYVGTIDQMRGVEVLLEALPLVDADVRLRLVGRVRGSEGGRLPEWLASLLARPEIASRVEIHEPVPYKGVTAKIDEADIVMLPAGSNQHYSRYAAPLKLFDYMVRGKPIVAAGVEGLREILTDRRNAVLYHANSPASAAQAISTLTSSNHLASAVAAAAWRDSEQYTYEARARRILDLAERG